MPRVISIFLPNWPTDRLRRAAGGTAQPDDIPLILAGSINGRRVVTSANLAAKALNLRPGMPVAHAQAQVPDLHVQPANVAADDEGLERLALWALRRFSPIVGMDSPDGIVMDSTGTDHLHGGEAAMLEHLVTRLRLAGIAARAAISDSWGAAHAFARHAADPTFIAQPGTALMALRPLPLAALRLPPEILHGLNELGFLAVEDLIDQPRAPLARRFGPELYHRLDQAIGVSLEPIAPIRSKELVSASQILAEPIGSAGTIAHHVEELVTALCAELEPRGLGARKLDLLCHRVDGTIQAVRIGLAMARRDPGRLYRLLHDRIEDIAPGFGIEAMSLTASLAEPLNERQTASKLIEEPAPDLSDLIDRLSNRVGAHAIYRFSSAPSDVPERSIRSRPPLSPEPGGRSEEHWPRPSRLLPRPEPIETMALLPDSPPNWFSWRGIRHQVRRADGPERIFGEWWKRDAELTAVRDYFRVEDESGERFWIFRAGDGESADTGSHRWFLHGIFG